MGHLGLEHVAFFLKTSNPIENEFLNYVVKCSFDSILFQQFSFDFQEFKFGCLSYLNCGFIFQVLTPFAIVAIVLYILEGKEAFYEGASSSGVR